MKQEQASRKTHGQGVVPIQGLEILALQESMEAYSSHLFEDTNLCDIHARGSLSHQKTFN